ncbi:polyphosphate kinase 2 family protein [Mycobacterium sp. KBS0706]|uniref:PPK2 family polyphosphate kinase n=1 Tax=Mycobacterium sp. KBS0706 TaxID=2578109 RepID=UPI00110FF871|nr:PPK2 family polyphosphate kinase [Mycobacterium sp. KBS0706]TSD85475.1 polyphosphate kinase 2 family protein [Mycobacterium sp. KBS0706]
MTKLNGLAKHYRVDDGNGFRLAVWDPTDTNGLTVEATMQDLARLTELQEGLYAQDHWSVLLILQGMDTAGKSSTAKYVMSRMDPRSCRVTDFRQPSAEELDHDFLWRTARRLPERGRIGVFNRSYYEEVLVVRVHPDVLGSQHLPPKLVAKTIWTERFEDINAFERHLARNGTLVLKVFLNVSKEEQRRRLLARLDDPGERWRFDPASVTERQRWDDYMTAYEEMIRATATSHAPWYVIPADNRWFAHQAVASVIVDAIEGLGLAIPVLGPELQEQLLSARVRLENE